MSDKNYSSINCPACESEMKQIYLNEQGITVDVCEKCGGIYFDNRELEKCDESFENVSEIFDFMNGKDFIKVDESKIRVCPVCGTNMVKNHTNFHKEVEIDACYSCGGKFLDNRELSKIREQNDGDNAKEMVVINEILKNSFDIEEQYSSDNKKKPFITFIFPLAIIIIAIFCICLFFVQFK